MSLAVPLRLGTGVELGSIRKTAVTFFFVFLVLLTESLDPGGLPRRFFSPEPDFCADADRFLFFDDWEVVEL